MAWVRRVDAGEGEALQRSFPVGERRRRVCSCGVELWERKVERRLLRSMVFDIMINGYGCERTGED